MKKSNLLLSTAIGSLIAFGSTTLPTAVEASEKEKCYGVTKAGKNDCQTSNSACAGTSTEDGQKDAWVYVPEGTCEKLVGGAKEAS